MMQNIKIYSHHEVNIDFVTRGTVFGHKGYIATTWEELVNEFGFPLRSKQPGATVEWQVTILRGGRPIFLTIYDLHAKRQPEDVEVWAVGGIRGVDVLAALVRIGFNEITEQQQLEGEVYSYGQYR